MAVCVICLFLKVPRMVYILWLWYFPYILVQVSTIRRRCVMHMAKLCMSRSQAKIKLFTGQWSIRYTFSFRYSYHLVHVCNISSECVTNTNQICISNGNVNRKICLENSFSECNPTLDYHFTGHKLVSHSVQHSKMMCLVQTLVCMFKVAGYDQNPYAQVEVTGPFSVVSWA